MYSAQYQDDEKARAAGLWTDRIRSSHIERMEACEKLFPNSDDWRHGGGCCVQPQDKARVFVCPQCNQARDAWDKASASRLKQEDWVVTGPVPPVNVKREPTEN